MRRTFLLATALALLTVACSSGNNKKSAATATPGRTSTPAATATPLIATPVRGPAPAITAMPSPSIAPGAATAPTSSNSTPARGPATAVPPGSATPAAVTGTPSAASPPSGPPPPPPIPTGTARGGRDSNGATLPVGELCPLGFPIKGADDQKVYKPSDPEYATIRPVACFQTTDDAITAGYTVAHP